MIFPEWIKPAFLGAGAGAAALAIVGFGWGNWMTSDKAHEMASDMAQKEVVAALAPICVEQSKTDPMVNKTMIEIKEAKSYHRRDMIMDAGWATMPGANEPDRYIAAACLEELEQTF